MEQSNSSEVIVICLVWFQNVGSDGAVWTCLKYITLVLSGNTWEWDSITENRCTWICGHWPHCWIVRSSHHSTLDRLVIYLKLAEGLSSDRITCTKTAHFNLMEECPLKLVEEMEKTIQISEIWYWVAWDKCSLRDLGKASSEISR